MRVKVVLSQQTRDLIWALGAGEPHREIELAPGEVIVELDGDAVLEAVDLFGDESLDDSIRQLAHLKLAERGEDHE